MAAVQASLSKPANVQAHRRTPIDHAREQHARLAELQEAGKEAAGPSAEAASESESEELPSGSASPSHAPGVLGSTGCG